MSDLSVQEEISADDINLLNLFFMIAKTQIIVILFALVSSYLFVFKKLKFKIDITGFLSLLLYLVAMIIRAVIYIIELDIGVLKIIQGDCQILVWYSLYFYELEMLRIKQTIEAEIPSDYGRIAKRHKVF